jgi:hypothetical protein
MAVGQSSKPAATRESSMSGCFTRIPPTSAREYCTVWLAPHLSGSQGCRPPHTPVTALPDNQKAPCDRCQFEHSSTQTLTAAGSTIQFACHMRVHIDAAGSASGQRSWHIHTRSDFVRTLTPEFSMTVHRTPSAIRRGGKNSSRLGEPPARRTSTLTISAERQACLIVLVAGPAKR